MIKNKIKKWEFFFLVILNPIGFVFMEIGKQQDQAGTNGSNSKWGLVANVIKGVCTNPIIVMTVLGIIGNFAFGGKLPDFIGGFLGSLGDAFSASALFLLGVNMVQNDCNKNQVIPFPCCLLMSS